MWEISNITYPNFYLCLKCLREHGQALYWLSKCNVYSTDILILLLKELELNTYGLIKETADDQFKKN